MVASCSDPSSLDKRMMDCRCVGGRGSPDVQEPNEGVALVSDKGMTPAENSNWRIRDIMVVAVVLLGENWAFPTTQLQGMVPRAGLSRNESEYSRPSVASEKASHSADSSLGSLSSCLSSCL